MTDQPTHDQDIIEDREPNPLVEATRKVLLATIGAVALGKDEMEDFINRLVERGEIAEKDGRKLMREVVERRKHTKRGAEDEVNKRVQDILDRLNVPTKKDIDELSDKVTALTNKLDELKKTQS